MVSRSANHLDGTIDSAVALAIVAVSLSSYHGFLGELQHGFPGRISLKDALFGLTFMIAWRYCFCVLRIYDKSVAVSIRSWATLKGVSLMLVPTLVYVRLFHSQALTSRWLNIVFVALTAYEVSRLILDASWLEWIASRDPRRAIIIGSGRRAGKAWRVIRTRYHSSITLMGFVDDRDPESMPPDVARRYLGAVDELSDLLLKEVVDMILIAMPIQSCYPLMQKAVHIAESAGVQVIYLEDIYSSRHPKEELGKTVFRELAPKHEHYLARLAAKRALDIFGAVVGLVLLSPLLLLIALGVKLSSNGPAVFFQDRFGYRRRSFRMVKFRSMVKDAEQLLPSLEHANEAKGPIFKMKIDPRVTSFGRFLRATSLDELPQLWNVLMGDMSLVGPRPMNKRDVGKFSQAALMRRFSVKPGMTGLWQVNGRSSVGFDDWMAWDNRYIDGWSLLLDLKILAWTVGAVIKRSGAM